MDNASNRIHSNKGAHKLFGKRSREDADAMRILVCVIIITSNKSECVSSWAALSAQEREKIEAETLVCIHADSFY